MDLKKKLEEAKAKIKEHLPEITIGLAVAYTTLTVIYARQSGELAVAKFDRDRAEDQIRMMNDDIRHVKETGHSVLYTDRNNEPLFKITPPDED